MLNELLLKFPQATTTLTTDNLLKTIPDSYFDCLVTTLTIAHIKNAEEAIGAWSRVLQTGGDLVITDFHPDMLAKGGKRSFKEGNRTLSVINYIHPLAEIKETFAKRGFVLIKEEERKVTETLRSWYERQNALAVYERFKGIPIIYGLHVKKLHAAQ
jgi:ubiquinone/menaquinone biosynthesis C-methylase UbiE